MGPETKPRVVVVDALRLLAAVEMVNGHTLDAVLRTTLRDGAFYVGFSWIRGLSSVAFMVAAGLSFHVTTLARFEQHRADPTASRRRIRRALMLIAIGYVLRFPFELVTGDPVGIAQGMARVIAVDVLQTIGLTLLGLELLVRVVRRRSQALLVVTLAAAAIVALAPLGDALSQTNVLPPLTSYLGHGHGSLFPLLPWSAYILFGVVAGAIALPQGVVTPARGYVPRFALLALLTLGLGLLFARSPVSLWHDGLARTSSPSFVVTKLGAVLGATAVLAVALARVRAFPAPLTRLAGETLAMYVFHLVVLYWTPLSVGAAIGRTLSVPESLLASALMILATLTFGLAWHAQKDLRARRRAATPLPAATR